MKVKINKLQSGGPFVAIRPVFDYYAPLQGAAPAPTPDTIGTGGTGRSSSRSSSSKSSSGSTKQEKSLIDSLLDEHVEKLIKDGALQNEYEQLIGAIYSLDNSSSDGFQPTERNVKDTLKVIAKVNEVINNKEHWDEVYDEAVKNGTIHETAMGKNGEVYYKTKEGKLKTISYKHIDKLYEEGYSPLTTKELLFERRRNPNLSFNNSVFNIAQNDVSTKEIIEKITTLSDDLMEVTQKGTNIYSRKELEQQLENIGRQLNRHLRKPTETEQAQINRLRELLQTPGEYIKESITTKQKQIGKAVNYIWNTLSAQEQKKLILTAKENGVDDFAVYLGNILDNFSGMSSQSELSTATGDDVPEESGAKSKAKNSSGSQTGKKNLTNYQAFHRGMMHNPNTEFGINDPNYGTMFEGTITSAMPIIGLNGDIATGATLKDLLYHDNYRLATLVDTNKMYFGNKKVHPGQADQLVYDQNDAARVYIPIKRDGSPDFDSFKEFKEIYDEYEANKDNWTKEEAERHFRQFGYTLQIDEVNGEKIIKDNADVKPFLIIHAYTNDATNLVDENPLVSQLEKDEEELIKPITQAAWIRGSGKNTRDISPDKKGIKGWGGEDLYQGFVFIPYRHNASVMADMNVKQGPSYYPTPIGEVQSNIMNTSGYGINTDIGADQLNN